MTGPGNGTRPARGQRGGAGGDGGNVTLSIERAQGGGRGGHMHGNMTGPDGNRTHFDGGLLRCGWRSHLRRASHAALARVHCSCCCQLLAVLI
jgi:hypothetical protein